MEDLCEDTETPMVLAQACPQFAGVFMSFGAGGFMGSACRARRRVLWP